MKTIEAPIFLDEAIYSLAVIKKAIYKNLFQASFLIRLIKEGQFEIDVEKKKDSFKFSDFLDDLNHYNFLESENKKAEPILNSILAKLKNESCC